MNGNFRRCVDLVTADRYVVMGCDDVLLPGYLAGVRALADAHPDAAVIAPGVEVIDADDHVVRPLGDRIKSVLAPSSATVLRGEAMATSLYRGNWTYFPSLLWRTDAVRTVGFREGLDVVLDLAPGEQILQPGYGVIAVLVVAILVAVGVVFVSALAVLTSTRLTSTRRDRSPATPPG